MRLPRGKVKVQNFYTKNKVNKNKGLQGLPRARMSRVDFL